MKFSHQPWKFQRTVDANTNPWLQAVRWILNAGHAFEVWWLNGGQSYLRMHFHFVWTYLKMVRDICGKWEKDSKGANCNSQPFWTEKREDSRLGKSARPWRFVALGSLDLTASGTRRGTLSMKRCWDCDRRNLATPCWDGAFWGALVGCGSDASCICWRFGAFYVLLCILCANNLKQSLLYLLFTCFTVPFLGILLWVKT